MYLLLELWEFLLALLWGIFSGKSGERPDLSSRDVLILPGWGAGKKFYRKLEKILSQAGYKPFTLDVPAFSSEKEYIAFTNQALSSVSREITVIAHNTAGLVVGALPDASRRKIGNLISLGTPYRGYKIFNVLSHKGREVGSVELELRLPAYLFINNFHPLAPIKEYIFLPQGDNLLYGQGRDQWFDIPGNFNLVRRSENLRTLEEYMQLRSPAIPTLPKDTLVIPWEEKPMQTPKVPKTETKSYAKKTNPSPKHFKKSQPSTKNARKSKPTTTPTKKGKTSTNPSTKIKKVAKKKNAKRK